MAISLLTVNLVSTLVQTFASSRCQRLSVLFLVAATLRLTLPATRELPR